MKPKLNIIVVAPTLVVALASLVRDESLTSFLTKVGGSYVFFSAVGFVLAVMWKFATPPAPTETEDAAPPPVSEKPAAADAADTSKKTVSAEPESATEEPVVAPTG